MADIPKSFFRRLAKSQSGLALTEFALSLPILTMLTVGFIELGRFINANTRISQIALSVADNTGRINQTIDITDVDAAFIGARIAGEGIDFAQNGRVILSQIEVNGRTNAQAGQMITWQRCFGAKVVSSSYGAQGDGANNATYAAGFGPTGRKIAATTDKGVMFVEVIFDYQPIFPVGDSLVKLLDGKTVRATAAYPVRDRSSNTLANGSGLVGTDKKMRSCASYSAD